MLPQLDFLIALFSIGAAFGADSEYRVIDATGVESRFSSRPTRVIPLQPSLAELVARLGVPLGEVVAVTAYSNFPAALKAKPSVGSYAKPNIETIASLKPDLVLASRDGTPKETVTRLRELGIKVVTVATETISGLRESYPIVGAALGLRAEAKSALAEFDGALAGFRLRADGRAPTKVLLQVGEDPLVVAAGKTFLNEGLVILGARNVYADAAKTYPRVSIEDVLKRDPEAIILVGMGDDVAQFERAEKRWNSFHRLAATRLRRIVLLRSDSLVRPGPRFPAGLADLERAIYGETVRKR